MTPIRTQLPDPGNSLPCPTPLKKHEHALMNAGAVCALLSMSLSQLYTGVRKGTFVPPIKLGRRFSRFVAREVEILALAYIEEWPAEEVRRLVERLVEERASLTLHANLSRGRS
jgi:predicted DNA-binding transcriptional regulator AlpA